MTISASSSSDSVEDSKVNVAVRVRPFNKRELDLSTKCVVQMEACQTFLYHPSDDKQPKPFTFDYCFESTDDKSRKFADNEDVFNSVGASVVDNAFDGYNACIFAYGQTGSGKSYTMMGSSKNPGIIPRLCNSIFERIGVETNEAASFKVEVSYMEIYNERVRDLLDLKKSAKCNLKVREHKSLGPMVDGLSVLAVSSFDQIARLIDEGNKCRTVAATNMNAESSRSHAVFTIRLTQTLSNIEKGFSGEKVAKISLVDLAGSERAGKTGAIGKRLEEGGNINKSLTTLGRVISALAERSGKKEHFVPYRDSVLTWLLKDNLGGNSKTVMIATVSPAADNYEETLSTLRYAERAKKIVNHAIINEDPNAKIIRELREEVEMLRSQIVSTRERETECNELKERLAESERLVERMNKSWEERLKETDIVYEERQRDLANIGICVAESGIKVQKDRFYLVNLNSDPSLNECLVYYINQRAVIGCATNGTEKVDFVLQGIGVQPHHAVLEVVEDEFTHTRRLFITPLADNARVCVNGQNVAEKTLLKNGSRVLIGFNHFFRVNCPKDNDAGHLMTTSIMMESQFDYDKAFYEANSDEQTFSSLDVVIEQINIKHQEDKQAALEEQYELFEKFLHSVNPTLPTPMTPMTPAFGFPMTPMAGTPSCALPPVSLPSASATRHCDKSKFVKWAQHREEVFKESLKKLKTEIVRANALAREANMITDEVSSSKRGQTRYDVTLQIPAGNLRPSRINAGALVCEPFIMVRRQGMHGHHLWSVEQLENKLIDMRDAYNDRMNGRLTTSLASSASAGGTESDSPSSGICDDEVDSEDVDFGFSGDQDDDGHNNGGPTTTTAAGSMLVDNTFESQEKHSLIGVANVFLEVLFHDMKLDYKVPIISQQGEVRGKLHVEVFRVPGAVRYGSSSASSSTDSLDPGHPFLGRLIRCRIRIKTATSLPQHLSHFVFCQYSFFNISDMLVVAPVFDPEAPSSSPAIRFDHEHDFDILVTDEFLEYVQEDALSIEVWGHRSAGLLEAETNEGAALAQATALKHKGLQERWSEVTSRLELWIDFLELNEDGHFAPVRVDPDPATAGVYHLKHGQQKRIRAGVRVLSDRGGLPVAIADITDVAIGSIVSTTSEQLDSYQEEDLNRIRSQWTEALANRQQYLQAQMDSLSSKTASRTSSEVEREQSLINQWVALTEERNAVSLPTPNSCIPGAPADWTPPPGIERHVPVVFLDLSADDLGGIGSDDEEGALEDVSHGASLLAHPRVCGENSTLPCERCDEMIGLPILGEDPDDEGTYQGPSGGPPSVVCSWDSTMHPGGLLNRATAPGERIYGVVTVRVRLSHPAPLDLVLRKRVALHVYKKPPSFTERLMQRIVGSGDLSGSGVCYDVVAHIPRSTHDVEDRESLAMMAARPDEASPNGPPAVEYVEAYTKCIQAVEWMLKLDRLRQESALRHMLGRQERARHSAYHHAPPGSAAAVAASQRMKRTVSLPNTINNVNLPPIPGRMQQQLQRGGPCGGQQLDDRTMETSTTSSSGYSSMVNSLVSPLMDPATVNANGRLSGIDEEQQPAGVSLLQHRYLPPSEPGSTAAIGEHVVRSFTVPETLHSSVNENFSPKRVSPRLLSELSQSRGSSFTSPLASTTTHTGAVPSGNFITPDRPSTPPDYSLQQADNSHSINNNNLFSCTNKLFDDEEAFIHAPPPATTTRGAPINGNGNGTLAVDFEFDVSHA